MVDKAGVNCTSLYILLPLSGYLRGGSLESCNSGNPQVHPPCFVEPSDLAKQNAVRSGKLPTVSVFLIKTNKKHSFRTLIHIFYPIRKEPGLKRRLQGDHTGTFQHLKGAYEKEEEGLYTWEESDRTWGNGFKVKEGGGLRFDIRNKFFIQRLVRQWRLPREVKDAPPHPGWMIQASLPRAGVLGLELLPGSPR